MIFRKADYKDDSDVFVNEILSLDSEFREITTHDRNDHEALKNLLTVWKCLFTFSKQVIFSTLQIFEITP